MKATRLASSFVLVLAAIATVFAQTPGGTPGGTATSATSTTATTATARTDSAEQQTLHEILDEPSAPHS
jgi:hypothetical protein